MERKLIAFLGLGLTIAMILAVPPWKSEVTGGLTLPFLPGVTFAPLGSVRTGGEGSSLAWGLLAWDWFVWEVLMATVLTLGGLAAVEVGRVHLAYRAHGADRITDTLDTTGTTMDTANENEMQGDREPTDRVQAGQGIAGIATAS